VFKRQKPSWSKRRASGSAKKGAKLHSFFYLIFEKRPAGFVKARQFGKVHLAHTDCGGPSPKTGSFFFATRAARKRKYST